MSIPRSGPLQYSGQGLEIIGGLLRSIFSGNLQSHYFALAIRAGYAFVVLPFLFLFLLVSFLFRHLASLSEVRFHGRDGPRLGDRGRVLRFSTATDSLFGYDVHFWARENNHVLAIDDMASFGGLGTFFYTWL